MSFSYRLAGSFLAALLWSCAAAAAEVEAITAPSKDVTLSFVRPGRVAEVFVKQGQEVKAEQTLVQLDDAAEQAQLKMLKAQAEDSTRIQAAQAQLAQKKVDLKKLERASAKEAATDLEVENARLEVTIAELSLQLSQFQQKQDRLKYEEAVLQAEQLRLKTPIGGRVEKVFVEAGESVDAMAQVVRVVQTDPLWIDAAVPLENARGLSAGQNIKVVFDHEGKDEASGRIIHVAAVADAASDTLTIRVEVPNGTGRPAGERVHVRFEASGKTAPGEPSPVNLPKGKE